MPSVNHVINSSRSGDSGSRTIRSVTDRSSPVPTSQDRSSTSTTNQTEEDAAKERAKKQAAEETGTQVSTTSESQNRAGIRNATDKILTAGTPLTGASLANPSPTSTSSSPASTRSSNTPTNQNSDFKDAVNGLRDQRFTLPVTGHSSEVAQVRNPSSDFRKAFETNTGATGDALIRNQSQSQPPSPQQSQGQQGGFGGGPQGGGYGNPNSGGWNQFTQPQNGGMPPGFGTFDPGASLSQTITQTPQPRRLESPNVTAVPPGASTE